VFLFPFGSQSEMLSGCCWDIVVPEHTRHTNTDQCRRRTLSILRVGNQFDSDAESLLSKYSFIVSVRQNPDLMKKKGLAGQSSPISSIAISIDDQARAHSTAPYIAGQA